MFVDIRIRRAGRAPGFIGTAFEELLGCDRYIWIKELGNRAITEGGDMQIHTPSAVNDLLDNALAAAKGKRRLIFFCQCKQEDCAMSCHRRRVCTLLLGAARRRGIRLKIMEWPGSKPADLEIPLTRSSFSKVKLLSSSVPLPKKYDPSQLQGPGWGSVVKLTSGEESIYRLVGPVQWRHSRWNLPIVQWYRDPATKKPIYWAESKRMIKSRGWAERRA